MTRHTRFSLTAGLIASMVALAIAIQALADTPLRIVTFNAEILTAPGVRAGQLQKYRWDVARRAQFERVAAVIETLNPDVLNLVEVTSREGVDLLINILHEKGLCEYRGYHVENNDSYTGMDVALISKIAPDPVQGQTIRTLFSPKGDPTWQERYSYQNKQGQLMHRTAGLSRMSVYLLTVDGYQLGFLGLHLKSNPSDPKSNAERSAQAKIVQ